MLYSTKTILAIAWLTILISGACSRASAETPGDSTIVQYGTMHEAIGQQHHLGRIRLSDIGVKEHFHGIGALEGLDGEVTIDDGMVHITSLDDAGNLHVIEDAKGERQATMLVGGIVPSWSCVSVDSSVAPKAFDQFIADAAVQAGVDTDKPFMFKVEGTFSDARIHVIHGACPVHARMQKIELPQEKRPFENDMTQVTGKIIGVFAKDAVGKLTHPATSTHMHLLFTDDQSGKLATAHIEKIGLAKGSAVSFPN